MSPIRIAELWHTLMTDGLGYDNFVAQGGDWGAQVTTTLGLNYPQSVSAIHLTMASGGSPIPPEDEQSDAEKEFLAHREWWQQAEGAYGHQHRTKPQTLSYGLNDSPAGLAGCDSGEVANVVRLRWRRGIPLQQGRVADSPDRLLGDADYKLVGPPVLRKRSSAVPANDGQPRNRPDQLRQVPSRDKLPPARVAGALLQPIPLHRNAQRRPLRGGGRAGPACGGY